MAKKATQAPTRAPKRIASDAPLPSPTTAPISGAFIDNPLAPEIFAGEAVGFFLHNGVVTVTLGAPRVDHGISPGPINHVVVARVSMPLVAAQTLAAGLYDFLKKMGADPVPRDDQKLQ